jgi:hypothetical protein
MPDLSCPPEDGEPGAKNQSLGWRARNARPEPDFKYTSSAPARSLSRQAVADRIDREGNCYAVWQISSGVLCLPLRRSGKAGNAGLPRVDSGSESVKGEKANGLRHGLELMDSLTPGALGFRTGMYIGGAAHRAPGASHLSGGVGGWLEPVGTSACRVPKLGLRFLNFPSCYIFIRRLTVWSLEEQTGGHLRQPSAGGDDGFCPPVRPESLFKNYLGRFCGGAAHLASLLVGHAFGPILPGQRDRRQQLARNFGRRVGKA